jgi:hypothetical protein
VYIIKQIKNQNKKQTGKEKGKLQQGKKKEKQLPKKFANILHKNV